MAAATSMGAISQASASTTANAGTGDCGHASERLPRAGGRVEQQSSLGQVLATCPPPVAMHSPSPNVDATTQALRVKIGKTIGKTLMILYGIGGHPSRATHSATGGRTSRELRARKRLRMLVRSWSRCTGVEMNASELDRVLGELAVRRDPVAEDIFTNREVLPASLTQCG